MTSSRGQHKSYNLIHRLLVCTTESNLSWTTTTDYSPTSPLTYIVISVQRIAVIGVPGEWGSRVNDVEDTMMTVRTHSNCRQDSGHDTALLAFDEDGLSPNQICHCSLEAYCRASYFNIEHAFAECSPRVQVSGQ